MSEKCPKCYSDNLVDSDWLEDCKECNDCGYSFMVDECESQEEVKQHNQGEIEFLEYDDTSGYKHSELVPPLNKNILPLKCINMYNYLHNRNKE